MQLRNLRYQKNPSLKKSAMKPTRLRQSVLQQSRFELKIERRKKRIVLILVYLFLFLFFFLN